MRSYRRFYINAVVSGSDVQGRKANGLLIPYMRSEGDLMKLAFGVSCGVVETSSLFSFFFWTLLNLMMVFDTMRTIKTSRSRKLKKLNAPTE